MIAAHGGDEGPHDGEESQNVPMIGQRPAPTEAMFVSLDIRSIRSGLGRELGDDFEEESAELGETHQR